ncbi:prop effector [Ramlibacter sp. G-1-2-2]|uniref:Prop effector n=1 Tax=Ramlibacter agri TaxID=2728837 RepID=A0A848GZP3_9BURK|nr:ProQ/FINO family protein [Ramlibacter agri]NML42280.1 prop effector [Ramlibacter agri]
MTQDSIAPSPAPRGKAAARKAPRPVHPLLEKLFELYPRLFGARFLPLKIGVFEDLVAAHPEALPAADLKVAIGLHTRSTRYIEAVASGLGRHDLQGKPTEPVAPEHVHHAILEVYRRRSGRAPEQARERAVAQLAAAVEASGLSREEYRERFNSPDDNVHAMLEEALAIVAQKGARREALQNAFQASGKTVAEFAEMYGLDPKEAKKLLG